MDSPDLHRLSRSFLAVLDARITRKAAERGASSDLRQRDLLKIEIAELHTVRHEFMKLFEKHLQEDQSA
jgi:hypothetical protein